MYKIDSDGHLLNEFTEGNPSLGVPATIVDSSWLNKTVQRELTNTVTGTGAALDKNNDSQLKTAVEWYANQATEYRQQFPLMASLSGSTVTFKKSDNTALSGTNKVQIQIRSAVTDAKIINADITSNVTFSVGAGGNFTGNLLGMTTAIAWANSRPIYIYLANRNDTNFAFFLSINPTMTTTLAATTYIAQKGDSNADDQSGMLMLTTGETLSNWTSKPCRLVGVLDLTKDASDNLSTTVAAGYGFGIDALDYSFSSVYQFPTGQMGAASGKLLKDNGGTAPVFGSNSFNYTINRFGECRVAILLDTDGGTDGSGAVTTKVALPYVVTNAFPWTIAVAPVQISTPTLTHMVASAQTVNNESSMIIVRQNNSGANLVSGSITTTNADFANGARTINTQFVFKAF